MNVIQDNLKINKCRVCGNNFYKEPLLSYQNMPTGAQNFPEADSLKTDKGADLQVYQCSGCGLVQLNVDPVYYYKEVVRASGFSAEMKDFRLKQFSNYIQQNSLMGKKVIEIGCGSGEYLSLMKQYGVNAFGIEFSESSVKRCVANGLNVSKGFVESGDYKINNGPFDAFFILSFLEHLPDPNAVLRGISNNLAEGAVGLVEVPNFDMILRSNLFSEFMRDHLFYFSRKTLNLLLELNGFEIIDCKEVWYDYIISATVRKRSRMDLSSFYEHRDRFKTEVNHYINQFGEKKVAIWGAGHQSLSIISLLGIADKLKYVIDSADFKQGKFTPATHIPVVSPDKLNSDPVEAIIVIAGSYSDEVARIIRDKYDKKINVAILRGFGLEKVV